MTEKMQISYKCPETNKVVVGEGNTYTNPWVSQVFVKNCPACKGDHTVSQSPRGGGEWEVTETTTARLVA